MAYRTLGAKCHMKLFQEHNSSLQMHMERITFSPVSPLMPSSPCSPCKRGAWCIVIGTVLTVHGLFIITVTFLTVSNH